MAQFARPASDVSTGGWVSTPLWSKLGDNSDADYVDGPGTGSVFVCTCNSVVDPLVSSGYVLRVRARRWGEIGDFAGVKVEILEGASTVRMTMTQQLVSRTGFTTYTYNPTAAEINAIGDHANLRVRVTEINISADSPSVAWVELEVPALAVPAKVTGLNATDGTRAGDSRLTWNAASGASSYDVYRHTSNNFASATKIKSNNAGTSYNDTGAGVGLANKRWYWIVSVNAAGDGPQSDPDTGYAMDIPSVPGSFIASDSTTEDGVDCTWAAATGDGTITYKLLRAGVVIYSGITGLSKRDTTGVPGTTYSYSVKSSNEAGDSAASTANNGTRSVGAGSATAPTNFAASDGAFQGKVRTTWDKFASALSYQIERAVSASAPFSIIASGVTDLFYDDASVVAGLNYYYRVTAVTASGLSNPSATDAGFSSTSSLHFFQEFLKALLDVGFNGTSAVSGLSATPTVEFEGLSSAYVFDPTDAGYATIPAGAKVGLTKSYNGAALDQVNAKGGKLWLDDATLPVTASDDDAAQLLLYANHGAYQPLVCVQDTFVGAPFRVIGGDAPTLEWSRLLEGLFRICPLSLGVAYPFFVENCLYALLGGSARHVLPSAAPTIKVNLLTSSAFLMQQHRYLKDLPTSWFCIGRSSGVSLTSVATSNVGSNSAKVTAADAVFTAPAASLPQAASVALYFNNADPAAALMALLWPLATPITFDGTDVTLQFDATLGIWTLGGA